MVTSLLIFIAISWAADRLGDWLRKSKRAQTGINRLAGAIFVLLACRLALSRQ
jgi:threonine/homoserine/homoserine lactone efflux protein